MIFAGICFFIYLCYAFSSSNKFLMLCGYKLYIHGCFLKLELISFYGNLWNCFYKYAMSFLAELVSVGYIINSLIYRAAIKKDMDTWQSISNNLWKRVYVMFCFYFLEVNFACHMHKKIYIIQGCRKEFEHITVYLR